MPELQQAALGLQPGDTVVSVNDVAGVDEAFRDGLKGLVALIVERNGERILLSGAR